MNHANQFKSRRGCSSPLSLHLATPLTLLAEGLLCAENIDNKHNRGKCGILIDIIRSVLWSTNGCHWPPILQRGGPLLHAIMYITLCIFSSNSYHVYDIKLLHINMISINKDGHTHPHHPIYILKLAYYIWYSILFFLWPENGLRYGSRHIILINIQTQI